MNENMMWMFLCWKFKDMLVSFDMKRFRLFSSRFRRRPKRADIISFSWQITEAIFETWISNINSTLAHSLLKHTKNVDFNLTTKKKRNQGNLRRSRFHDSPYFLWSLKAFKKRKSFLHHRGMRRKYFCC